MQQLFNGSVPIFFLKNTKDSYWQLFLCLESSLSCQMSAMGGMLSALLFNVYIRRLAGLVGDMDCNTFSKLCLPYI